MSRSSIALSIVGVLLLSLTSAQAQTVEPTPTTKEATVAETGVVSGSMRLDRLGLEDGLPTLGPLAINQDSLGFMWFGLSNSLARYDGSKMLVFVNAPDDPKSLSNNSITSLAPGTDGEMWIGTEEGGLNLFSPKTRNFTRFNSESHPGMSSNSITELHVDRTGQLWIAFATGGLATLNPETQEVKAAALATKLTVSSITENKEGQLFFGTVDGGVLVWDSRKGAERSKLSTSASGWRQLPSNKIMAVHVDKKNRLWVGTQGAGLVLIAKEKSTTFKHDPAKPGSSLIGNKVSNVFDGPDDSVWLSAEGSGIGQFREVTKDFENHDPDPLDPTRLSKATILSAFQSQDGVSWIGPTSGPIHYFDRLDMQFELFRFGGIASSAIAEDRKNSEYFWFAAEPSERFGGLYRVNRKTREYTRYSSVNLDGQPQELNLATMYFTGIHDDGDIIWLGSFGANGLLGFKKEAQTLVQIPIGPNENDGLGQVMTITDGGKGVLWLSTWGHGIARLNPSGGTIEHFLSDADDQQTISSNYIYSLKVDPKSPTTLWIATAQGGLNKLDTGTGKVKRYLSNPEDESTISNDNVLTISIAKDGKLWLGTYGGGLNLFTPKTEKFKRFQGDAFPDTVYGILRDERGHLWISTNGKGLLEFVPKTETLSAYTAADGIQGDVFAQGGSHRGNSGIFYFGGTEGITVFNPNSIRSDDYSFPVTVTEFRVFDAKRKIPKKGPIELSYDDSVVSFDFAGLAFAAPDKTKYEYRLVGLSNKWLPTEQRSVTFTSLDPGDYKFQVRATGRHGAVTETIESIDLYVAPPPWRSWWAYTIYGLLVIAALVAYQRFQQRKIVRIEQESRLEAVERDLQLTAAVQTGFLPASNHVTKPGFELVGLYRAAGECSGDWWWYEQLAPDQHLIVVGDVTGHGPGPAMVTASVSTTLSVLRDLWKDSGPEEFLQAANQQVYNASKGEYLMQAQVALFDSATGLLKLYSAAGVPVLCVLDGKLRNIVTRGAPLGSAEFEMGFREVQLAPGDRFMLLTDGIPEVEVDGGKQIGLRAFGKLYRDFSSQNLESTAASLVSHAQRESIEAQQEDDWTFVIGEYSPSAPQPPQMPPA